jgi:hypothetical protein
LGSEPRVPQCDREHAVELVQEVEAAVLVQMDERLDVRMAGGCSASRSSMWVVDLAVEDNGDRCRPVATSLTARRRIPDEVSELAQ